MRPTLYFFSCAPDRILIVVSDTGLFGAREPLSIRRAKEPKLAVKREAYGKSSSFLKTMCTGSFYRSQVRRQCVQIQADNFYLKREPTLRFEVESIPSGNWNSFLRTVSKRVHNNFKITRLPKFTGSLCLFVGRDDWIRTSDLSHPKRTRYQTALRPEIIDFSD